MFETVEKRPQHYINKCVYEMNLYELSDKELKVLRSHSKGWSYSLPEQTPYLFDLSFLHKFFVLFLFVFVVVFCRVHSTEKKSFYLTRDMIPNYQARLSRCTLIPMLSFVYFWLLDTTS